MGREAGPSATQEEVIFLGTAGARIMVSKQLLASGGLWLNLGDSQILLDPGPGCLVQAARRKLETTKLKAIILSHRHLDHSGDVNAMIEAMTEGGFHRRGVVFAPRDALEGDPVILQYVRPLVEQVIVLEAGQKHALGQVSFEVAPRHIHPVETYGFVFHTPQHTFSYIADTRYFGDLAKSYRAQLIILCVLRLESSNPLDHLSVPDAANIIRELKPQVAILTHFGMTMWRAHPWEVAASLSQETGVRVIAARDGMRFDLAQLDG